MVERVPVVAPEGPGTAYLKRLIHSVHPGVTALFGRPGAGKTCVLRHAILDKAWPLVAAYDPEFQLRYPGATTRFVGPGYRWQDLPKGSLLVIDEIDRIEAKGKAERKWLLDVINMARPWELSVMFTARRTAAVSRDMTACARLLLLGRTNEPLDIEYLSCWYPAAARLRDLPPMQFIPVKLG